mmetsp:Transcript_20781/g.33119  ORF Transcript_20781/g.33119 Transcript_20781/m.33119 type:complete len:236 (-) Transcript_20781:373-1080(-)
MRIERVPSISDRASAHEIKDAANQIETDDDPQYDLLGGNGFVQFGHDSKYQGSDGAKEQHEGGKRRQSVASLELIGEVLGAGEHAHGHHAGKQQRAGHPHGAHKEVAHQSGAILAVIARCLLVHLWLCHAVIHVVVLRHLVVVHLSHHVLRFLVVVVLRCRVGVGWSWRWLLLVGWRRVLLLVLVGLVFVVRLLCRILVGLEWVIAVVAAVLLVWLCGIVVALSRRGGVGLVHVR